MAVTLLGSLAGTSWTTDQAVPSFSHTLSAGSNRWVWVIAEGEDAADNYTTATYDGQSMTQIFAGTGNFARIGVWVIAEADLSGTGSKTVAVSAEGNFTRGRVIAHAVQDADQTAIAAAQIFSDTNATDGPLSDTLTSITDGMLVGGLCLSGSGTAGSLTYSGGTLGTHVEHEDLDVGAYRHITTSRPVTVGATVTATGDIDSGSSPMAMAGLCFSPFVAASGTARGGLIGGGLIS